MSNVHLSRRPSRAFTLIELIGVLAIIAIMASVLAPTTLRSLSRAARDAERSTLHNLADQVRFFLRTTNRLPGVGQPAQPANMPPAWALDLATVAGSSAQDLWKNSRGVPRTFLLEPGTPTPRAMVLSCLRTDTQLNLPPSGVLSANAFDLIWQTADGSVPPVASWNGWNAWNTQAAGEDLIIGRMSLQETQAALVAFTVHLNHSSGRSGYAVLPSGPSGILNAPPQTQTLTGLHRGDRVDLSDSTGRVIYSFVVIDHDQSFDFDGTVWRAR